jgi:hypothetical protein
VVARELDDEALRRRRWWVHKFVASGQLRKAGVLAESQPALDVTPAVVDSMFVAHPKSEANIDLVPEDKRAKPRAVELEDLARALRLMNPRATGGGTGWTVRLLRKAFLRVNDFQPALHRLVCIMHHGLRVGFGQPSSTRALLERLLLSSRLCALPKPGVAAGVRPVAVGDALYRVAARSLQLVNHNNITPSLLKTQFGWIAWWL